jgi:4-hydroxythreonine-4-phosphate dehydrogenase
VCGLNPHAGDKGLLGTEETRIISPAICRAQNKKIDVTGPLAADAVFYDVYKGSFDAVICMYHDQGLVALKMIGRDDSVNITMGLPFVRTSPGHGTALDIAKKGIASGKSTQEAIRTAINLCNGTNA